MEEILRIDQSTLKKARVEVKRALKNRYNFYDTLLIRDSTAIGMLSRDAYETAESLENFLATFYAVRECTQRYLSARGFSGTDAYAFLNMFSTYAGLSEARENLSGEDIELSNELEFLDFSEGSPSSPESFLETIITSYIHSVKQNAGTGGQIKKLAKILYNSLEDRVLKEKSNYPVLESIISGAVIVINSVKIKGFSRYGGEAQQNQAPAENGAEEQTSFEDIIGNKEAKAALKRYAEMLFLYSPEERNNPILKVSFIPRTVFLYARPGTGKTSLAAAMRNYMQKLSGETGKKMRWTTIDSSIKSKWYGETEEILKAKTREAMSPDGIGVIFIDDIDGFVVSRAESSVNAPDKSMTVYLMQIIEGIDTPYYGNYIILSASNKPSDLDEALLERIGEASFLVPGPQTVDEYAEFIISKLKRGISAGYVQLSREGLERASRLCIEYSEVLSPREISKALRMLQENACSSVDYEQLRNIPSDEINNKILNMVSRVGDEDVIRAIMKKYEQELLQRKTSQEYEVRRLADEIQKRAMAIEIVEKSILKGAGGGAEATS